MAKSIKLVTGVKEIDKAFRELPLKFQKKALRPALRESAKIIAAEVKRRMPVDTGKAKKIVKVSALKRSRTKLGMKIAAGADQSVSGLPHYIKWVEFGSKDRYTKKGAYRGKIVPESSGGFLGFGTTKGFMRPALKAKRKESRKIFIEKLSQTVRQVRPVA